MLNDAGRMGAHSVRIIFIFVQAVLRTSPALRSIAASVVGTFAPFAFV